MIFTVDVGGTHLRIAAFKSIDDTTPVEQFKTQISGKYESDIAVLVTEIFKHTNEVTAVALSVPGVLNSDQTRIAGTVNLPDWQDKPLVPDIQSKLSCKNIFLIQDVQSAVLSEIHFNNLNHDAVFVIWGSGIGGCRIRFDKQGEYDLEQLECGFQIIDRTIFDLKTDAGTPHHFCAGVSLKTRFGKSPTEMTDREWTEVLKDFAITLTNIGTMHRVPKIILGGGVALKQKERILNELPSLMPNYFDLWEIPEITIAKYEDDAGLLGGLGYLQEKLS